MSFQINKKYTWTEVDPADAKKKISHEERETTKFPFGEAGTKNVNLNEKDQIKLIDFVSVRKAIQADMGKGFDEYVAMALINETMVNAINEARPTSGTGKKGLIKKADRENLNEAVKVGALAQDVVDAAIKATMDKLLAQAAEATAKLKK